MDRSSSDALEGSLAGGERPRSARACRRLPDAPYCNCDVKRGPGEPRKLPPRPWCEGAAARACSHRVGRGRGAGGAAPAAEQTAKTVLLHSPAGYRFAVIPASDMLDLNKAAAAL